VTGRLGRQVLALLVSGFLLMLPTVGRAQARAGSGSTAVFGVVSDPTGAVVRGAQVSLVRQSDEQVISTGVSGLYGMYRLDAAKGVYRVKVSAPGFAPFESDPVEIPKETSSSRVRVNVLLQLAAVVADVNVPDAADAAANGRDLVLKGRTVQQLPLDPTALKEVLAGLAGSSSAQILVDGFSGGKLPSRNSIREIRINENPYSADNDTDTARGVVQVLTQPGGNQLHGYAYVYGDDSQLNAPNPFASEQPPYYADGAGAELTGSIGPRTNAYVTIEDLQERTNAAIDALTLNTGLLTAPAVYTAPNPRTTVDAAARLDAKLSGDNTLITRYSLRHVTQSNQDVGQLVLASQGLDEESFTHTLQLSDTSVISSNLVAETRLQYIRTRLEKTPASTASAAVVEGAFIGGGSPKGSLEDHQDAVELQSTVSIAASRHFLKLGGRLRTAREANLSRSNFNGQLIFSSLNAYAATLAGLAAGQSTTQIAINGGGASQYIFAQGDPNAKVLVADGALFVDDSWKLRQNLKVSYGLRFETQNFIGDHADWAPRAGFAWGLGGQHGTGAPKYMVRGGAGVFYQRFGTDHALDVTRFDGTRMEQYVQESPQLCLSGVLMVANCGSAAIGPLSAVGGTVYRVNPGYQSPYILEASAGVERQLGARTTVRANYLHARGLHMAYIENANAPLPGTYSIVNPASGTRPEGSSLNVYQYDSEGVWRRRQLTSSAMVRGTRYAVTASYMLQFNDSDTESNGLFPLNRLDKRLDYGRSSLDQRHVGTLNANLDLPYGISSWAYMRAASGAPYNLIVGQDLNGDTQFNDRPAFATDLSRASVVRTALGAFDTMPLPNQRIVPRNFGQGPGSLTLNIETGKQFGFGPRVGGAAGRPAERKFSAELQVLALNVLNHPNLTQPIAVVDSPLFGRSVGLTGGGSLSPSRCFDMQLMVKF